MTAKQIINGTKIIAQTKIGETALIENTKLNTPKSSVDSTKPGAYIKMSGNNQMIMDEDGSITFTTGNNKMKCQVTFSPGKYIYEER